MRINFAKDGAIVESKVDGKKYVIHEKEGRFFLFPAPLTEGMEAEIPEDYKPIEVVTENAICFRYLYNPVTPEIPQGYWNITNGTLFWNGAAFCEQGELEMKEILGVIPGALVMTAKSKAEGKEDIFVYRPDRDRFRYQLSVPEGTVKAVAEVNDGLLLAWFKTNMEEVVTGEEEDGTEIREEKERFEESGNAFISRNFKWSILHDTPVDAEQAKLIEEEYFAVPQTKIAPEGFIESSKIKSFQIFNLKTGNRAATESIAIPEDADPSEVRLYPDRRWKGNFIARGNDFFSDQRYFIQSKLLRGKEKFLYLVDITEEEDNTTMTFADPDYHVLQIMRKKSKDRGFIDTIL